MKKYPDSVRVVSKQFVIHPDTANLPALGVCAARAQGKAARVRGRPSGPAPGRTRAGGRRWTPASSGPEALEKLVAGLGMDAARWKADADSPACKDWVAKHYRDLATVGVSGTPAFFINGRPFQGQRTVEGFSVVIDEELKKAEGALASGVKLEDYYAQLMASAKKTL
jgi:hypothetical protein